MIYANVGKRELAQRFGEEDINVKSLRDKCRLQRRQTTDNF